MSEVEDLIEGLLDVGILAVTYQAGQEAQKSFVRASEENNWLGMLLSAVVCGGSMYAFQSSARNLNRLFRKHRISLPVYDLRQNKANNTPVWYLPK